MSSERAESIRRAQGLFTGVADGYDGPAQVFGLFRHRFWHRELARLVAARRPALVLDMCTGTGAVAAEIAARSSARVVGVDVTRAMLAGARRRTGLRGKAVDLLQGAAQAPPFRDGAFDAVIFTFLLRYVEDVPGTLRALGRLVRPGGLMASLEFGVPEGRLSRAAWILYTRTILRAGLALLSPGWKQVGGFLGNSIERFHERWPLAALEDVWRGIGFRVEPTRRVSLGGGVIMSGIRGP